MVVFSTCLLGATHEELMDKEFIPSKVLGQKGSSDRWLPSNPSKNPTSMINHPSTTMPPEKSGYLTDFEKGQIVALKEKNLYFSEIGQLLHCLKSTV